MSYANGPKIVTNGLVFCIDAANSKCNNGAGFSLRDLSGNNNSATMTNGTNISGSSFNLPNSASYIRVTSQVSNYFNWTPSGIGFNTFSAEVWVRSNDAAGVIISKPWNGSGEYNYLAEPATWTLNIANQSSAISYDTISTGRWEHVVYIATPTVMAVYRNGTLNTGLVAHNITNNNPTVLNDIELTIGTLYPYETWGGNDGYTLKGDYATVKYYNRVLSAAEVLQNFNCTKGRFGI